MKLSNRDATVVALSSLHADKSIPELAKRCGLKTHTVRYILTELQRRKLLQKRWVIDLMSCGWGRYELFFSSSSSSKKTRQSLLQWLIKSSRTTYIAEVGGDFDYEVIILAHCLEELKESLEQLTKTVGEISFSKAVAIHQRVHYFPRKYLSPHRIKPEARSLVACKTPHTLDELDHKILQNLSLYPDSSQRELAQRCSCMPITIQSRMEKLRSHGVLKGAMFSFQATTLGVRNYIFLIYAKGFDSTFGQKLYQFCLQHPHCTNMKECFGSWDFEAGVEVLEHSQLLQFKEELLETFPSDIHSIKLLSRFTTHKYALYPFNTVNIG